MQNINQQYLDSKLDDFKLNYQENTPFPNIAIDHFLTTESAQKINCDFPDVSDNGWTHYIHFNERKHGLTKWEHLPKSVQELITEMSQPSFIQWLEKLTGINTLFADPNLEGSGLHQTLPGGFLNIHTDFTVHPLHSSWRRRVNVLIYFNPDWPQDWGGDLELWDAKMQKCEQQISPVFNRAVIFSTSNHSFHGYPNPIACPDGYARKSLAMYFYTAEKNPLKKSTHYKSRPNDGLKKPLIWADNKLLSVYTSFKGVFGLKDNFASSILNILSKTKRK